MSALFSGACACGAIRYECSAAPLISFNCHCRDCQKTSGSAFLPLIVVPADALKITKGQPKYYAVKADSGRTISRGFCQDCGSTMLGKVAEQPAALAITAGSLDDPSRYQPSADIYISSAQPWDHMNPALPKHAKELGA
jgi:hypothetical protein